jgi:hypothetical protein
MKQTAIPASTLATLAKSATDGRREERNAGRNANARSIEAAQEAALEAASSAENLGQFVSIDCGDVGTLAAFGGNAREERATARKFLEQSGWW